MQTIAICGVGLIGGSFGLALREAGFQGRIIGVSSPATIQRAKECGAIDEGLDLESAVPQADLVYLAQPVCVIRDFFPRLAPLVKPGALVTDAGSTKQAIVEAARRSLPPETFLGGHPMAGKAERGVAAAEAGLFRDRPYLLTPSHASDLASPMAGELQQWIAKIGARLLVLTPEAHDRVVAAASHVPQLLSTALGALLEAHPESALVRRVAGPGLLDMTRLAGSDFALWREILDTNDAAIGAGLDDLIQALQKMRISLKGDGVEEEFTRGNAFSRALRGG